MKCPNKVIITFLVALLLNIVTAHAQSIITVAGNGLWGFAGDGGAATNAKLNGPYGIVFDRYNNMYFSDFNNNRIRKIDTSGVITTIAGTGAPGYSGDGGPATAAQLYQPGNLALDAAGNLYFDADAWGIRKISTSGIITRFAGNSLAVFYGDGGPATAARLDAPGGMVFDAIGNMYLTLTIGSTVRKIDTSGTITTVAGDSVIDGFSGDGGPATDARLYMPTSIAIDRGGNIFFVDRGNSRVRKINTAGIISNVVGCLGRFGGDGFAATDARLSYPEQIVIDSSGNLYVSDADDNRIRKVDTSGIINTFAGNGLAGYFGDGGCATASQLLSPQGLGIDSHGNIYIGDDGNDRIRKVSGCATLLVPAISGAATICPGTTVTLSNAVAGGNWHSSDTTVASISSSGLVTGVSLGLTNITYTHVDSCGVSFAVQPLNVTSTAVPGIISGPPVTFLGDTNTYHESVPGGVWSSSNSSIATINPASGFLTPVSAGVITATYTVVGCGATVYAYDTVAVNPINRISGKIVFGNAPVDTYGVAKIWLIKYNPSTSDLEAFDSTIISLHSVISADYQFLNEPLDSYRIKAAFFPVMTDVIGYAPTYFGNCAYWNAASVFLHDTTFASDYKDIKMIIGTPATGPGFIGGNVTTGANKGTSGGVPVEGLSVLAINTGTGKVTQQVYTNASGMYLFNNLPIGQGYTIYPELLAYGTIPYNSINLTASSTVKNGANFMQHTISKIITPNFESIPEELDPPFSFKIFPNPASSVVNIQYENCKSEQGIVIVRDILGREVYSVEVALTNAKGSKSLILPELRHGLYLMNLKIGSANYFEKLLIAR